mgnify:CR=1 FL=1
MTICSKCGGGMFHKNTCPYSGHITNNSSDEQRRISDAWKREKEQRENFSKMAAEHSAKVCAQQQSKAQTPAQTLEQRRAQLIKLSQDRKAAHAALLMGKK